jgi:protein-L-isoaspartate(D-aspartate) O-methyltransferase
LDFTLARSAMIESQVRPNDVTDRRVIAALSVVPKEMFVPESLRLVAYADCALQVSADRHLWGARDFSRLLQAAEIEPGDRVLEIAAGVGYATAVLVQLGASVTALESDEARAGDLRARLQAMGIAAQVVAGDLRAGYPAGAPYDVIWVNGAIEALPPAWLDQLAEGGRCALVLREGAVARATVYRKSGRAAAARTPFEAAVPMLPGFERAVDFQF